MVISKAFCKWTERVFIVLTSPIVIPFFAVFIPILWLGLKVDDWLGPKRHWTPWFAWRPVKVGWWPPDQRWVWLEWVERKDNGTGFADYRNDTSECWADERPNRATRSNEKVT